MGMENKELQTKIDELKARISKVVSEFKDDTGLTITDISIQNIDASSKCGSDFIPGTITTAISL